jgi:hypothetical protein
MRYHNGVLRNEQDSTLRLRRGSWERKLTSAEYLPLVVLSLLMLVFILISIFYY